MGRALTADLCIIGAGSAGLSVAAGAQQMGARCVLIERGEMGGDCLNTGCVPSKSLLAAGKAAKAGQLARKYGIAYDPPYVDFQAVHDHVHGVIAALAPVDSQERFEGFGVTVLRGAARFTGPRAVAVDDGTNVRARRFVLATGSVPLVPPIPGLAQTPYLTNETVFDLRELPRHLVVIGGGPVGVELGQAFAQLGAQVSILDMQRLLPNDDEEVVDVLRRQLSADGVRLYEGVEVTGVSAEGGGVAVTLSQGGQVTKLSGSHLLVAAGRKPAVEGLDLEKAGVGFADGKLRVDARLRTTNRRVYAAGDVVGGPQFTHVASYHASIIIKNALFRLPAKADHRTVPWVTYTSPELAHVGMKEDEARARHGDIRVLRWSFAENDRAHTARETSGMVKAVATAKGRILGCTIVGESAGELILPWVLAMSRNLKIGDLAQMIAPYPTLGDASKRVAGSFYTPKLFSGRTRSLVRFLAKLG